MLMVKIKTYINIKPVVSGIKTYVNVKVGYSYNLER